MITMALLQGVLNTFVIVLARVVGGIIDSALSGNREGGGRGFAYYIIVFVLEMVFGLFATMISMWFSRHREFRADAGGASLAGRQKMIAALERLQLNHGQSTLPTQMRISAGGARRVSLPVFRASSSGASCRFSASPRVMPTSGLSALTTSSNTSPSMP
ncbi:hypothetical protein G6F35_015662 [Rhizopus arrhizus]|nr:hypothetical protein G6F35_015662 [Rhizopus arrhizus]